METIKIKSLWILIIALLIPLASSSQDQAIKVSGTVKDNEGIGLPGVSIVIEGTTYGTSSFLNGEYEIEIPREVENPTLVFSYISFKTQSHIVGQNRRIDVILEEDTQVLDEFVVIGYGVQRKIDLTGSVSNVDADQIRSLPVAGIDQSLQGRAAGVNITSNTGMPGEGVNVRIRGVGSINSSNDPLYIVDGVPTVDALSVLSTSDIESISILKDAASAAIYGARANNGVIIITTRKGTEGKTKIEINSQVGFQEHGKLTPMTNRDQYISMYNEAANNDNAFVDNPIFLRNLIDGDLAATLPDVDHLDAIFRKGFIQNQTVSINGGNDKLTYLISTNLFEQQGIIIGSHYKKHSGRVSLNSQVNDYIRIGTNINISKSDNDIIGSSGDGYGGNGGSVVRYALFRTPAIPVHDQDGQFVDRPANQNFFGDGYNPVGLAEKMNNNRGQDQLFGDVNAHIQLFPYLHFTSTLGMDKTDFNQRRFNETWGTNQRINNPNSLQISNGYFQSFTASNVFSYNKVFADVHSVSAMIGTETIRNKGYTHATTERDFPDQADHLVVLGNGVGSVVASENKWANSLLSFFGRANYTYNRKYLLSLTLRRDGSSRFSDGNQWGNFYSVSGAWRIDQESFMENNDLISMLKLRVGYGAIGNQEVGNYPYSDQLAPNINYPFGGVMSPGYAISNLGNRDLKWETSTQIDVGLDMAIWQNKLSLTMDYYRKITADMLVREPIPPSAGYAEPSWVNNGEILNTGIELDLSYRNQLGDVGLDVSGNFAYLRNEVLDLGGPIVGGRIDNGVYATRTEVGQPIGSFYLYKMEGIFQNDLEITTNAHQGNNIYPGDVRYADSYTDGYIDERDRMHVGSAIPKFSTGLQIAANYKNIDASMFWQGDFGHKIYYQVATDIEGFYRPFNVTKRYYDERWTGEGTSNTQPRASWSGKSNNTRPSTRFLENGSYLRLKNVQIGYTLPQKWISKLAMTNARIYLLAHNMLTFTKYPGLDPEMTTSDNSKAEGDAAAGIDWGTYPLARSYNIGIQIKF
ncbi:TonB-linked outer membrane protein, SusC/RagA family [Saccharicrinis carchari]|uniref:TonB-linked outer membrane protein, SusC/RagA family n=1 Tax=Saccharicrinis carchari TaxID=1168039 RepID=A0A521F058_SACCC|nr:TonB-dependent receptor [Saccharicrinis carchari]SMO88830.1 TonB-linked outer membrane protein, SusC/RagA family [Saccharicrinis carchari]